MDDFLYTIGGLGSTTLAPLPSKFKISNIEKFDGSSDSRQHIQRYLGLVGMKGFNEKQALCAFPMSFVDQFIFNTMIDMTLRDLGTTKQGFNETFSEFMMRRKNKVLRKVNRPNEKD